MEAIFPRVKPAERRQEQVISNPPQFYERTHDLYALKSSEGAPLRTSRGVFTGHVAYVPSSTDLLEGRIQPAYEPFEMPTGAAFRPVSTQQSATFPFLAFWLRSAGCSTPTWQFGRYADSTSAIFHADEKPTVDRFYNVPIQSYNPAGFMTRNFISHHNI